MRTYFRTLVATLCLLFLSSTSAAVNLTVGVAHFYPPFVMKADKQSFYGFDISLVNRICKEIDANCTFKAMTFGELHDAILRGQVDLAVSSIVITPARLQAINFTLPYMLSNGRLLARSEIAKKSIQKTFLDGKRIGIEIGTVYHEFIDHVNPKDAKILFKAEQSELVEALMNNQVDIVVLDNPSAIWWSLHSSGKAKVVGKPFKVGQGLGIAVASKAREHIPIINQAILNWQKDGSFQKMYNTYFNPVHTQKR